MWLTDLEKLTDPKYGLTVRFEDGWRRRGASGGAQMRDVCGVLWHHTAGSRKGNNPSRNILVHGRAGLSGPLCHINFPRDGTVEVVAAGKANHAGKGQVPGVLRNAGNTRLVGIEMESAGTRPWDWTPAQLAAMPLLGAALSDIFGLSASQHWGHMEYSSTGKIDPAGLPGGMAGLRSRIAAVRIGSAVGEVIDAARPWRTSTRVAGMSIAQVRAIQAEVGVTQDGVYGDQTGTAVAALQAELELTSDGVYGPGTEAVVASIKAIVTQNQVEIRETRAIVTENQRRIGQVPGNILDAPIKLAGQDAGKTSSLRTKAAYEAHEHRVTQQQIAALRGELAGLEHALRAVDSGEALDLDQVRAAAREGVDQALNSLEVTVTKGE